MKKVILLSSLLIGGAAFAQTNPIDFEPGGNGADFGWATFEAPEGFDNPTLTIEANPVTDGVNTSATAAKLDIGYGTDAPWGQAGTETDIAGMEMGIFTFDENNSVARMMVFQEDFAAPVALKFVNSTFGSDGDIIVQNDVFNEWVELEFDLSGLISSGVAPFSQLVILPSYGPRATGHAVWFDNITFGAGDPPLPDPMVSAPDPTIDEDLVLSVYSDTYLVNTVAEFNLNVFGIVATEVDIESDGNQTAKLENLNFYGAQWIAEDINEYDFVHLDYYATSSTGFNFYLIDLTSMIPGGSPDEPRYSFGAGGDEEIVQGEWVSVDIPLQHFLDQPTGSFTYDLDDIFQYKFDGIGTLFFDNVYFAKEPTGVNDLVSNGLRAFPNPSVEAWMISSDASSINEVRVYNALGQVVLSQSPNASMTQIDASNLDKGFYIAEIRTDLGMGTIKLIKE
ncbi:T9SS type A sorting domain-containing protein [Cryomorphaceae bacterium 1068]|nr:T9SS type A sorting domain-containing protein [Cryomorphaceae bacterium 1068]